MLTIKGLVLELVFLITLIPMTCHGGGILHVFPPKLEDRAFAVARPALLVSKTAVTVSENTIRVRIDQTFLNDNEFPLKGLYLLPLIGNSRPAKLDVRVNDTRSPFTIVSFEEFFPTLKDLTLSMSDPSLLGLAGMDVLLIRDIGIGAGRQKSISIQYELPYYVHNDLLDLPLSLAGERYALGPVGKLEITVRFTMSRTVRTVFSPSHHVTVFREAPHRCLVKARIRNTQIRHDFRLLTTFSGRDFNLRLFAHRSPGKPGTFMAFIEPPYVSVTRRDPDQEFVVLLDTSGSMAGTAFERAKAIAVSSLERLRPHDRFNVMTLATRPSRLAGRFMTASRENVLQAVRFINSKACGGGTDLYNGLISALEFFDSPKRSHVVLLITDGKATVGPTDPKAIVEAVRKNNHARARIFITALGNKADVALLDRLATSTKGISFHISAADDLASTLKRFFPRISPPMVSDISLDFKGTSIEDIVPSPIPDIFGPESIIAFGRYIGEKDALLRATLRGRVNKRVVTVSKTFSLPLVDPKYAYISEIRAMRQMALIAEKLKLKGPLPELAKKAADLAAAFGFVNPVSCGHDNDTPATDPCSDSAKLLWNFKTSCVPADVLSSAFRSVKGKVFRWDRSGWTDTDYQSGLDTTNVRFLSKEYFSLLKATPQVGAYLALGPKVTVVLGRHAIRIKPENPAPAIRP